ncbi:LLM class F420-dependent oxidoreductase [Amycolatopsis palatopharyngis]|uniref:LLM class F420-dependent oxidoreductase n=1 Tax=Amycolatopsis palatopharyngis TaxID=187982 RepID=UPI000E23A0C4|nr:LLM class F420-dependent oxidoreductase [Amycolatopsis palatopharyngis]
MKIGISTFATDEGIAPAALGRALEERGFESLFLAEHSHIPVSRETPHPMGVELPRGYYRPVDPFVALGAISSVTTSLRLGTGLTLLIQRDVIHTAKEVATLDLISAGRVIFGVGVGWNREEMRNHGTDPRVRGALLDEQLEAIREIWTKEEAQFHGRHVDFDPIFQWPKPVQRPHPPIYVGGNGEPAVRRVAAHANGWLPNAVREPDQVRGQLDLLREHAGPDVPVTATSAAGNRPDVLDAYAEAGVERVTLGLPSVPEADTLAMLDRLAEIPLRYR